MHYYLLLLLFLGLLLSCFLYPSSNNNVEAFTTNNNINIIPSRSRRSMTMTTTTKQHPSTKTTRTTSSSASTSSLLLATTTTSNDNTDDDDSTTTIDDDDDDDELSEERKANLFQFLLRDLQVEGVPLLGVNADKTYIMEAAIWTTMAQLNENPVESKACMIFENLSINTLNLFVNDFMENLRSSSEEESESELKLLQRFNVSLVGKGIGPAILIETSNITTTTTEADGVVVSEDESATPLANEWSWQSSMKSFVERMIIGQKVCPHMAGGSSSSSSSSSDLGPYGLDGIEPGPIAYRLCGATGICDIMSAFWNCICELQTLPDDQISCTILATVFDDDDDDDDSTSFEKFTKVCNLLCHSLDLYDNDDEDDAGGGKYELLYLHPNYNRNVVIPNDQYIKGHLPPTGWLKQMLGNKEKKTDDDGGGGNTDDDDDQDDELGEISNYSRRSPLPAIVIKRVSHLSVAAAAAAQAQQEKEKPARDGKNVDVGKLARKGIAQSKIDTYCNNLINLNNLGKDELQSALEAEIEQTKKSK